MKTFNYIQIVCAKYAYVETTDIKHKTNTINVEEKSNICLNYQGWVNIGDEHMLEYICTIVPRFFLYLRGGSYVILYILLYSYCSVVVNNCCECQGSSNVGANGTPKM